MDGGVGRFRCFGVISGSHRILLVFVDIITIHREVTLPAYFNLRFAMPVT